MELIVIFNILFLLYVLSVRKKAIQVINEASAKANKVYGALLNAQNNNELIVNTFDTQSKNKIYELSLILINIKNHYEETLSMTDEYCNPEYCFELQKSIKTVDDQLREIGFMNNKTKVSTSILKEMSFIKGTEFSKN